MMKNLNILFILLLTVSCADIPSTDKVLNDEDAKILAYLFDETSSDVPSYSYFVIKDGVFEIKSSIGYSDLETSTEATPETIYKITSTSKQFSAMALMLLINQGKLTYETTLTEIFPSLPSYCNTISVRHLLTHQSGLISYYQFIEEDRVRPLSNPEIFDILQSKDSTYFETGTQFQYNQTGYALIPLIVEKLSGQPFAVFMKDEIFEKLGMNHSSIYDAQKQPKNRARGYLSNKDSTVLNEKSVTSEILGSKGVLTTVADYYKWDQALYSGALLPKNKLEEAFYHWENHQKTTDGGYGYGWYVDYENGHKVLSHYGSTTGFTSQVTRVPELQLTTGVFSNYEVNVRNLIHKTNALTSIYSDYKVPMPIETLMKMHIDNSNIQKAMAVYDKNKNNKKYKYTSTGVSLLGSEYYRHGKIEEAKALYEKSILEHPEDFGGFFGLGRLAKRNGNMEEAIAFYTKVVKINPDNPGLLSAVKRQLSEMKKED
ncbi:MAG: serine hydrolase [Croceivirga sp.]